MIMSIKLVGQQRHCADVNTPYEWNAELTLQLSIADEYLVWCAGVRPRGHSERLQRHQQQVQINLLPCTVLLLQRAEEVLRRLYINRFTCKLSSQQIAQFVLQNKSLTQPYDNQHIIPSTVALLGKLKSINGIGTTQTLHWIQTREEENIERKLNIEF